MADPIPFDQMPFRLKVLVKLTELLQTISRDMPDAAPTYSYSLAPDADFPDGRVLRGRVAYGSDDPLPMLAIVEDPKQLERDAVPLRETDASPGDWDLLIQGFIKDDPVHPTDPAYFLAADTVAKLTEAKKEVRNILGLGSKKPTVDQLHIGAPVIRPPDDISATTYFWLPVRLHVVEDPANAFT
jgi:hypothetical protein